MGIRLRVFVLGILLTSIFSSSVFAEDKAQTQPPTKEIMHQFLAQLGELKKFLVSKDKFTDPKNTMEISSRLKEFAEVAKKTQHDPMLNQENFKFSRQILEEHIVDTERVFRLGNKAYARWQLNSTISLCMSCHSQMPASNRTFEDFQSLKIFSSEFDQAEFLFATRKFDQAFNLYNQIVSGFPKNNARIEQVESSLEREVAYFSRIRRDPTAAIAQMKKHQKAKELPEHLQRNISAWISQFTAWSKQKPFDAKAATEKQIIDFAKQNIELKSTTTSNASNPNLVNYLRVSGILFEYLQSHPLSKATPEVLYWLSICERSISSNFFYSLADLYLRECIVRYPGDAIAKKCFKEYEEETILGYTGSSGTNVPGEVRRDLNSLKKLIETGGKVELHGN